MRVIPEITLKSVHETMPKFDLGLFAEYDILNANNAGQQQVMIKEKRCQRSY